MSSEGYHEPYERLPDTARDLHRALVSMQEELAAIDWYQQRAVICADQELREILLHNQEEEVEHALMILEWLRRKDPMFAEKAETYLFSSGSIVAVEEAAEGEVGGGAPAGRPPPESGSLGTGSLKTSG